MQLKTRYLKCLSAAAFVATATGFSAGAFANSCQNLVWSDEFNGTSVDTSKWEFQTGDGCDINLCGWGNNEEQSYKAENATVDNGLLTITAKKERVKGSQYTSARMRTAGMAEFTHGRFEARIKLPDGTGMWPAFWMLPTDPDVGWPMSGEIDILEATGQADMIAFGTIHYGQPYPDNEWTSGRQLKQPDAWSDDFHTYAIEWEPYEMRWYVDDVLYSVKTPADMSDSSYWTFENYQYHFILNMAVGGSLGGWVDDSMLPQTMQVDYVRAYDTSEPSLDGDHIVDPGTTATYSVIDETGSNSTYAWTVPAGATVVSGAGTNTITVDWGTTGGDVSVTVDNGCGTHNITESVYVLPELDREYVFDDFEGNRNFTYTTVTGSFNESAANPGADTVNSSSTVAAYTRDSAELYDVIAGDTAAIADAGPFISGDKAFYMDVYTAAPVGTDIIVQLEDSSAATDTNYPTGRHSKYVAHTTTQYQWERLKFHLEDRIDGETTDADVNSLVVLIAPNSNNGDTYYWDNFDIYGASTGSGGNNAPTASFSNSCTDLMCDFDGSASADSDGSIVSYEWDFGDGATATGISASHAYAAAGDYTVSLTVTDDAGATATDTTTVSVTDSGGGDPATTMSVSAVTTGTANAGKGAKYATAQVTVTDDAGNPVADATVTGDFSGSITEAGVSAVTDANGVASLQTTATAKGNLTVQFCVGSLSHASLTHDTANSTGLCP